MKARRRPVVSGREELIGSHGEVVDDAEGEGLGARAQRTLACPRHAPARKRPARARRPPWTVGADVVPTRKPEDRSDRKGAYPWSHFARRRRPHRAGRAGDSLRILREYERGVVFQLGRFWKVKGPGLVILIPVVQQMVRVDLRTVVLDVPPQDVITRDNVSVKVNAVVYFRVVDPQKAIIQVEQLPRRHQPARADDAARGARQARARRAARRAREAQPRHPAASSTRRPTPGASRSRTSRSSTST